MTGFGGHSTGTNASAVAMVDGARVAVKAMDRALGNGELAGPADAYHVLGSLCLMTRTLQGSMSELATWLCEEVPHRQLTAVGGPFVDDPESAVNVAAESLMQASRGCREVFDALERAHIAMANVGAEQGPMKGAARRGYRRRRLT